MVLRIIGLIVFCALLLEGQAQTVWMHPNKGQWDPKIRFMVELGQGEMYLESSGFTYFLTDTHGHAEHDDRSHSEGTAEEKIKAHVIRTVFEGASQTVSLSTDGTSDFYRNYFLGSDSSRWKTGIRSVEQVLYAGLFPGVDMLVDGSEGRIKSTYTLLPFTDPGQIRYRIEGASSVELDGEGKLIVEHRFGSFSESSPVAWTESEGKRTPVKVRYELKNGLVSFVFPEGYDRSKQLIIDPYLVFSTFTGSTADNWGMTATPDDQGNLYAGGIVFTNGGSYPVTTGAFDISINGGANYTYTQGSSTYNMPGFDVAISKFNATGTTLMYSTYLGGSDNEAPHSMVTDETGSLYVFGVTGSSNFPTVGGCYDVTFNGGPYVAENELGYPAGADLYIVKFNPAGTALSASTFVGGTGTDGINIGNLNYNYGDSFRGEIVVENGSIYVSSTTESSNFPTVGASQGSLSGAQDAVVFKMSGGLTTMQWSTYFGGSGLESGNSVQVASNGNVYMTGGTNSSNLPITGGFDPTFNGGISDGYLVRFQGTTATVMSGTYLGYGEYDQAYFVQLDGNNEVYVYGQSETGWPISPGTYGTANSGQFLAKYTTDLVNQLWTTSVGAGSGHPEISPTAFLVSDCYDIYFSGWGGTINSSYSNQAAYSTTYGFLVTPDAYQTTTNGSNFYIAVLNQNASSLQYATFMGGTTSSYNHVDGGTSRFDKSGRIYHAVCGACGGNDYGFTSTPGVWSPTNNSVNCNLAAFKFELNSIEAIVSEPEPLICLPDPVIFNNNSANGNAFFWDFGDNTTSTEVNPSHLYAGPGIYTVTLVVSDSNGCFSPDSVEFIVNIGDFQGGVVQPGGAICPGIPFQLEAYGGAVYSWSPAAVLDDPSSATPTAIIYETTVFTVIVSDSCGADTLVLTLPVYVDDPIISNDTSICIGNSAPLSITGTGTFLWTPASSLDDPTSSAPVATPTITTEYFVETTTSNGCIYTDSVTVSVFYNPPVPIMPDQVSMCVGSYASISVSGGDSYLWSPNYAISSLTSPAVTVTPADDFMYYCTFFNACGSAMDSVFVDVVEATIFAGNDTIICPGQSAVLWASGGISYYWYPNSTLSSANASLIQATPTVPTLYSVIGTDQTGCTDTAQVFVDLFPQPFIQTNPDVYAIYGDVIQLSATSTTTGPYIWSPAEFLSCVSCQNPVATPNQDMTYTVTYVDQNGCTASDVVNIYYDPLLYIPNTFTPNGDEFNQGFRIYGSNIKSFEFMIFDRWGELIFTMDSFEDYWDGSYKGLPCQDGTYVWKIRFYDFRDNEYEKVGHVNLLR